MRCRCARKIRGQSAFFKRVRPSGALNLGCVKAMKNPWPQAVGAVDKEPTRGERRSAKGSKLKKTPECPAAILQSLRQETFLAMLRQTLLVFLAGLIAGVFSPTAACAATKLHQTTQPTPQPTMQQAEHRVRLGLVLSGGGARGFAHIGVLKALEELNIAFDVVAGTSMGAMVGGGFAAGYTADEIRDITLSVDWPRMFAPRPDREKLTWRRKNEERMGLGDGEIGLTREGLRFPAQVVPSQELDIFLQRVTEPVNTVNDLSRLSISFAAMATDLENGTPVVLQRNITLAQAMRASMSVPGAYAPVQYEGKLLVDGGLVANLPVDEARAMGAGRLVVINVGTPLNKRDRLGSIVGIMGQVVNLLTEQNVKVSKSRIREDDIYIEPDLEGFTSGDFMRASEIIERGYEAAMAQKEKLRALAVSRDNYQSWAEARSRRMHDVREHNLSGVQVAGLKTVNPERVRGEIDIDISRPVTNEEVADAARSLWATGDFQSVPFKFEPGPYNSEVLVFEPTEKDYGYSVLRFGGNVESNFAQSNTFNVMLSHTWGWLNNWGGRWTNLLQAGEVKRIASEWHQPLGSATNFFLQPEASYEWEPFDVYNSEGDATARYHNERLTFALNLGYDMGRFGRVTLGGGWLDNRTKAEIGAIDRNARAQSIFTRLNFGIDTLDDASFPTKGLLLDASVWKAIAPDSTRMNAIEGVAYDVNFWKPVKLTDRTTMLLSGRYARAPQAGNFNLGGVFNLSGSPYGRWAGNRLHLARALVYHDFSRHVDVLRMPFYLGASAEIGRAYDEGGSEAQVWQPDRSWKRAASLYMAADSWVGPIYLVAGRTFGEGSSITLYWGQLH